MLLVPDASLRTFLEILTGKTSNESLVLRLYKNNRSPGFGDTAGNYSEADFLGYAAVPLTPADWVVSGSAQADYPSKVFTGNTAQVQQDIYGYFVTGQDSGKLYWAERFDDSAAPYGIRNSGDTVNVTLQFTQS